jgi:hypothetical protein
MALKYFEIIFFWYVILLSLVERYQRFGEILCSHLQGIIHGLNVSDLTELFHFTVLVKKAEIFECHLNVHGLIFRVTRQDRSLEGFMYFCRQLIFICSSTYNPISPSVAVHKGDNKLHTTTRLTDPISAKPESLL